MADDTHRLSTPRWYLLLAIVVSMLALAVAGVIYTNYSIKRQNATERENDRRWCALLSTLDGAYSSAPPQTETGRRVAAAIHDLRIELGCP